MISRRHCFRSLLAGAPAFSAAAPLLGQSSSKAASSKLAMPGLFRGRVVSVESPASIVNGQYQAAAVQTMMRKGMMELTGAPDHTAAWKMFVEPGDVVGIKLTPVGMPYVVSDATVVREIVSGLNAAGIKNKDIVVYDRYKRQMIQAKYPTWLPEGVRWMAASEDYDNIQQKIEGYDPDHYMDMALTLPGYDLNNLTARRSYAAQFITKHVNKLINVPCLKDHQSAGITIALKNLSHGLVNNVNRSHSSSTLNACGIFIPSVVAMPVIRNKTVLNIVDGVKGLYHGGPGSAKRQQFVWEHKTMYFATDPVAVDRVGWEAIDAKRVSAGMKKLAEDKPDSFATFLNRQTEHVEIAGALGLGEWNLARIDHRKLKV